MSDNTYTKGESEIKRGGSMVKVECKNEPIAIIPLYQSAIVESESLANAKLIAAAPNMLDALESIANMNEGKGQEGCTYGDTNFDSLSAAYGYNTALDQIKKMIESAIKKATT